MQLFCFWCHSNTKFAFQELKVWSNRWNPFTGLISLHIQILMERIVGPLYLKLLNVVSFNYNQDVFVKELVIPQYCSVRWFIMHHGLVYWIRMHISQWDPRKLEDIVAAFMEMVHMVAGRYKDYIINRDQSPIPFTFDRQRTLELADARTVHICKSTFDTKRATIAETIMASGKR